MFYLTVLCYVNHVVCCGGIRVCLDEVNVSHIKYVTVRGEWGDRASVGPHKQQY